LRVGVGHRVHSLELDAYRKVVAALATLPGRDSGVPCAERAGDELQQRATAPDQEVRGDAHSGELVERRVRARIKPVGKKFDDGATAELARRQRDVVNDQQGDAFPTRSLVAIGRSDLRRRGDDPRSVDVQTARGSDPLRARMESYRAWNRYGRLGNCKTTL
jgi:hypothetical protein